MSSSRAEVKHIFPSITHEAIPLAADILRKLRAGSAPGKGYHLKAEETAALPGVSAFLAAQRLQSHDLSLDEARKRSSVSAPHFKSCLATARHILATTAPSPASTPAKRSTRSSSASHQDTPDAGPSKQSPSNAQAMAELTATLVSTSTKKRPRPGSSRDLSGLLDRTPTKPKDSTPVKPSPLKQSTTPSKATRSLARQAQVCAAPEEEDDADEMPATPSKRSRHAIPTPGRLTASTKGKGRATVDTTAFFAAKPDTPAEARERVRKDLEAEERALQREMEERWRIEEAKRFARGAKTDTPARERLRRDWTYHEAPWTRRDPPLLGSEWMENLLDAIPKWCAANGYATPSVLSKTPESLTDLYLTLNVAVDLDEPVHPAASEPTVASESSSAMDIDDGM